MGSHQAASSSNVISNRGLIRRDLPARKSQARECRLSLSLSLSLCLFFFLFPRAPSASVLSCRAERDERGEDGEAGRGGGRREEEKKGAGGYRDAGKAAGSPRLPSPPSLPPLPATAVRTIELFFRADFRRSSAGARASTGYQWSVALTNCRRPVSICRSDYFVPPKRATVTAREPPPALSPAIRNFLPILLSRAAYAHCASRRAVMQYFARPSVSGGTARRASVQGCAEERGTGEGQSAWLARCNLIAVTNSMSAAALFSSRNPLASESAGTRVDCDGISANHDTSSTTRGK